MGQNCCKTDQGKLIPNIFSMDPSDDTTNNPIAPDPDGLSDAFLRENNNEKRYFVSY